MSYQKFVGIAALAVSLSAQTQPWAKTAGYIQSAVDRYHRTFDVYTDAGAAGNNFHVRAAMGPNTPGMDDRFGEPCDGRSCLEAQFFGSRGNWGGWAFLNGYQVTNGTPQANWGTIQNAGVNLTGATTLEVRARGESGGERIKLIAFGVTGQYPDSAPRIEKEVVLSREWTTFTIPLTGLDLRYVLMGFGWTADAAANGNRDIRFWLDDIRYNLERPAAPRLAVSYEVQPGEHAFDQSHGAVAYVYDNALAIVALVKAGLIDKAKPLVDGLIYASKNDRRFTDGRLRAAYQGGELASPPGWMSPRGTGGSARIAGWYSGGQWIESPDFRQTQTGDMLWAMIALLAYHDQTADAQALETAKQLGAWVFTNAYTPIGLTAGVVVAANDASEEKHTRKSTEHNLDAIAAFRRLYVKDPDPRWQQAIHSAAAFLSLVWNGSEGRFAIGVPDSNVIPLDVQAWAVQALGLDYVRALDFAEVRHKTGIGYGFRQNGLTSGCGDQPWLEGTGQMALSWLLAGRADRWSALVQNLRAAQLASGAVPATTGPCVDTGLGWTYYPRPHLGATAWTALAEMGINPYAAVGTPGSCLVTLSRYSSANALRAGGDILISLDAPKDCRWEVRSDQLWAQVFPLSGTGPQTLFLKFSPNFWPRVRSATVRAGSTALTVGQDATVGLAEEERFIDLLYFSFFGRLPAPAERAYHIANPRTRVQRTVDFFFSEEFRLWGRFVAGAYVGLLNREPEYSGWLFQRDALARAGGNSARMLAANILASEERRLTFGTPTRPEFIRLLYQYVLGRVPSTEEVAFQDQFGGPEAELAHTFLRSPEFALRTDNRLVPMLLYATLLQRDMTPAERAAAQGRTPEQVATMILSSPEGQALVQ